MCVYFIYILEQHTRRDSGCVGNYVTQTYNEKFSDRKYNHITFTLVALKRKNGPLLRHKYVCVKQNK